MVALGRLSYIIDTYLIYYYHSYNKLGLSFTTITIQRYINHYLVNPLVKSIVSGFTKSNTSDISVNISQSTSDKQLFFQVVYNCM